MAEKIIFFALGILATILGMIIKDIILKKKMTLYQLRLEFFQKFWLEFSKLHQTYLTLNKTLFLEEVIPELESLNENCGKLKNSYSIFLNRDILMLLSDYEKEINEATIMYKIKEKKFPREKKEEIQKTMMGIFEKIESAVRKELFGGRLFNFIFKMGY